MKKYIAFVLGLVCLMGLVGCSSEKTFDITGASKIELRSGTDGTAVDITDEEDIKHITDNINAMKFSRGKSSKNYSGWSYSIEWYDSENNLMEKMIVMSEFVIDYNGYFYTGMDADNEIDIHFFDTLLDPK